MQYVDCLSRLPVQPLPQEVGPVDDTELFIGSVDCEEEQEEINRIIHFLKGPNIPCPNRAVFRSLKMEELFTENGILYLQPNKQVLTSNQAKEEIKTTTKDQKSAVTLDSKEPMLPSGMSTIIQ